MSSALALTWTNTYYLSRALVLTETNIQGTYDISTYDIIEYIDNKQNVKFKDLKISESTKEKLKELKEYDNDMFFSNSRNENNDDKIKWICPNEGC
jgi:hypothetical protein